MGSSDGLDKLWNALPILVVNGATLLIVVVILIRVIARVLERGANGIHQGVTSLKDEVTELRSDIRASSREQAVAIGGLTERVSRIEGKIEGIAIGEKGMADTDEEVTPVSSPIPRPPKRPGTGGDNVYIDPTLTEQQTPAATRRTPAGGIPRIAGGYSMGKSRGKP